MLKTLFVKNFAIIDELQIEFGSGLNIITGETGAGKSILIGALGLVLGERANAESVRKGAEKATIEAILEISANRRVKEFLELNEFEPSDELIIRREISAKGQSRCFINDSPVTLSLLSEIGELCIDLHGQHDHQSLLKVETHIRMLDEFAGLGGLLENYSESFQHLKSLKNALLEMKEREKLLREKRNLYEYQIKEIDALSPEPGELDNLLSEQSILENSERLYSETNAIHELLYAGDDSVYTRLVEVRNMLQDLARIDKSFGDVQSDAQSALVLAGEISKFVQSYNSRIEFNAERLSEVQDRMNALQQLRKKYGGSIEEVIAYRKKIGEELELVTNFEEELGKIGKRIKEAQKSVTDLALRLSQKRNEFAERLSKQIGEELAKLGIPHGKFDVAFQMKPMPEGDIEFQGQFYAANENGGDWVEFLISTNLGEDLKPLAKVASGGEISRVMLAMKTVLAKSERLPILVFDEIDTGISGKVAQSVGFSVRDLARFHQIIAITHLPQIAAMANHHYFVSKKETADSRTVTMVDRLSEENHIKEVAKLISGMEVTEAALLSAKELILAAN
ncbi:MAG: DNA repair protein RecN [Chloroherpetonaceae bacterium]|nr:DNA repair protein RecN [Chloroherpetonaceae bacterium]